MAAVGGVDGSRELEVERGERSSPSLTEGQKKLVLGIIFLSLCGIAAMVTLSVPGVDILSWKVSLGASLGLVVIIGGSICLYRKSKQQAAIPLVSSTEEIAAQLVPSTPILTSAERIKNWVRNWKREGQEGVELLGETLYYNLNDFFGKVQPNWTLEICKDALRAHIAKRNVPPYRIVFFKALQAVDQSCFDALAGVLFNTTAKNPENYSYSKTEEGFRINKEDPLLCSRIGENLLNLDDENFLQFMRALKVGYNCNFEGKSIDRARELDEYNKEVEEHLKSGSPMPYKTPGDLFIMELNARVP